MLTFAPAFLKIIQQMKKLIAIFAVAAVFAACNNASETSAATVDTAAAATVDTAAATVDTTAALVDSAAAAVADSGKAKAADVKK